MCLPTWWQLSRDQVKGNSFELFNKSICWLFICKILPSDKYKGFLCWGSVKQYVSEIWKCQIQRPQYSNSKLIRVLLLGRFQCLRWRTETFAFPKGEHVNRIDRVVSELLFCFQKSIELSKSTHLESSEISHTRFQYSLSWRHKCFSLKFLPKINASKSKILIFRYRAPGRGHPLPEKLYRLSSNIVKYQLSLSFHWRFSALAQRAN